MHPDCTANTTGCLRLPRATASGVPLGLTVPPPSFTAATGGPTGGSANTYTASWADVDGDGDADLFVGNWGGANELWINDGTGGLTAASGGPTAGSSFTYTAAWGDVDGDGDLDLFVGVSRGVSCVVSV